MKKVEKYTLTIENEDRTQKLQVSGVYLTPSIATQIFKFFIELWDKQSKHTESEDRV
jgi:hypothetical protein